MTTLETASTEEAKPHSLHALVSTRPAAIIVFVFLVLICLYGLLTFINLYRHESEAGVRFIDDREGMLLAFIPLFRALGAMLLALDLRQYLISLGAIQRNESDAQEKLIKAIRSWWTTLSIIAVFLIALMIWSYLPLLKEYTAARLYK